MIADPSKEWLKQQNAALMSEARSLKARLAEAERLPRVSVLTDAAQLAKWGHKPPVLQVSAPDFVSLYREEDSVRAIILGLLSRSPPETPGGGTSPDPDDEGERQG